MLSIFSLIYIIHNRGIFLAEFSRLLNGAKKSWFCPNFFSYHADHYRLVLDCNGLCEIKNAILGVRRETGQSMKSTPFGYFRLANRSQLKTEETYCKNSQNPTLGFQRVALYIRLHRKSGHKKIYHWGHPIHACELRCCSGWLYCSLVL